MTMLHKAKIAAAVLPEAERDELAAWLSESKEGWDARREQLRKEVQIGLDEIERGELAPLDMAEIKRKARLRSAVALRG